MKVLIAGGGPTGLTLGIDLARRGVEVRVVDKADKFFGGSRGDGIQPRTLEVFDDLGVIDAVLAEGHGPTPIPASAGRPCGDRTCAWPSATGSAGSSSRATPPTSTRRPAARA
jgi:hypothetical protein